MVSVVIPTHNRSDLITRAVESVQKQTHIDIEIIVVSDGSTDDTKQVVEKLAESDKRIRFIEYFPAKGGNIARNTGIEESKGEYVAFLDDDDEWYPSKLEKQLAIMQSDEEIGLVYTGVNIIYVNENVSYSFKAKAHGDLSAKILLDNCIGTTSTAMVKKSVFEKSGIFDVELKALQDFDLWIRICQIAKVGVVSEEMINYYNYTGKKQVSALTQKYIDSFGYINDKYADAILRLSEEERQEKQTAENFLLANKAMRNGEAKLARTYLKKILKEQLNKKALAYYVLSFFSFKVVLKVRSILG